MSWHLNQFWFRLFLTPSPQVVASSLPPPTSYCSGLTAVGNPARGCQRSQRSFHNIIFGDGSYSFSLAIAPVGAFSELCEHIREISLTGLSPSRHCCWTLNSPRTRHISRELGCTGTYVKCLIFLYYYIFIDHPVFNLLLTEEGSTRGAVCAVLLVTLNRDTFKVAGMTVLKTQ